MDNSSFVIPIKKRKTEQKQTKNLTKQVARERPFFHLPL